MVEFVGFPKIPRYSRDCVVTEKIDGTSGCIYIPDDLQPGSMFYVGSRTRWITPENDNHGFARWAYDNADELLRLGPGRHFGEWWGQGINRGYGLKEKRFSLFNVHRWGDGSVRPTCCHLVPVLWEGSFPPPVDHILSQLSLWGSVAAQGFLKPEGIVIFHKSANLLFKKTLENDEKWKGES